MKKYVLCLVNGGDYKYVATENDIDNGGWVDCDIDLFGFDTIEDAEYARKMLLAYATANGWVNPEILIEIVEML